MYVLCTVKEVVEEEDTQIVESVSLLNKRAKSFSSVYPIHPEKTVIRKCRVSESVPRSSLCLLHKVRFEGVF